MRISRTLAVLLGAATIVLVAALAFAIYAWKPAIPLEAARSPSQFSPAEVARGEQLARIGNCNVCHTRPGARPFAGGRPLTTPFGTLYSVNITPHVGTGIGGWPKRAFVRAMREGVDAHGRHLYPAFPYTHFTKLKDEDLDALYAFLMTREPVDAPAAQNRILLPLRFRPLLAGWKLLFLDRSPAPHDEHKSAEWNRGAYLVEALAHCGACHTPRNPMYAEKRGSNLAGGQIEGWRAPPLNGKSPAPLPWTRAELLAYLRQGFSANHGIATGPMADVPRSLGQVPEDDVAAIATYVASFAGRPSVPEEADAGLIVSNARAQRAQLVSAAAGPPRRGGALDVGAALYASACARCHEPARPNAVSIAQPLALSTALNEEDATNVANIILEGIGASTTAAKVSMPPFRGVFDANQISLIATYLRATFTNKSPWKGTDSIVREAYRRPDRDAGK